MVDVSAIESALSSLKAAKDIAEAMVGLRDASAFQGKLIEFQSRIIDVNEAAFAAQEERAALLDRIEQLKVRVAELESWETEKQRYELVELVYGVTAYALKECEHSDEPEHYICANCYQQRIKSILQSETRFPGRCDVRVCHRCGAALYVEGSWDPEHAKAALRR